MLRQNRICFLLPMIVSGVIFGGYEVHTIEIPELHNQIIPANYFTTLTYDFSEIVDCSQSISRLIFSMSGDFTPGVGYFDSEYGTLDGGMIRMNPFDNYRHLGGGIDFSKENASFSLELDSEKMIGTDFIIWDEPYPGYSGDVQGEIDFDFGQGRTSSTVVETWPVIEITEATWTVYVIPEPVTSILFGLGGLVLTMRRKVLRG